MNDREDAGMGADEDEELAEVARALGYDEHREPHDDRVAAVRAEAARLRAELEGGGGPRTERRGGRAGRRTLLVGSVAAAVGALAGAGVGEALSRQPQVPTERLRLTGVPAGVTADARLINHTWGTEVLLDVRDLPPSRVYRVALDDRAGSRVDAGSFRSVPDVLMVCRFNAAPLREEVDAVVVLDDAGAEVMRADLPLA